MTAAANQNLFDLVIQLHGDLQGLLTFLLENQITLSDDLDNTIDYLATSPLDTDTIDYLNLNNFTIATGSVTSDGEFNDDYDPSYN